MKYPVIEIQSSGNYIGVERGFIKIQKDKKKSLIPHADIESIIISGPGNSISTQLINRCSGLGTAIIICNEKYHPSSILWPLVGHYKQKERFMAQMDVTVPFKKQLWKDIVKQKILNQAKILKMYKKNEVLLMKFYREVKSGDLTNMEAQAARIYWKELFGADFKRDPNLDGINSYLNFGYAIIRSSLAREVVSSGLHPSLGVFHHNLENPFCLVDDLIEPFRPLVDLRCKKLYDTGKDRELSSEVKNQLIEVLQGEVRVEHQTTDVKQAIQALIRSLSRSYLVKKNELNFFHL